MKQRILDVNQIMTEEARYVVRTAGRPMVTPEQKAQDLAQRMVAAIKAGDNTTARSLAIELKPLMGLLPEGN